MTWKTWLLALGVALATAVLASAMEVKNLKATNIAIDPEAETVCITWTFDICLTQTDVEVEEDDGSEVGGPVDLWDEDGFEDEDDENLDGEDDGLAADIQDPASYDISGLVTALQENPEIDEACMTITIVTCLSFDTLRANSNGEDTVEVYINVIVVYGTATDSDTSDPVNVAVP